MKLLTAVLAVAVLGTQASPLAEEPKPRLDQVVYALRRYLDQLMGVTTMLLHKSELGQEINQWRLLGKFVDFFEDLNRKVPPTTEEHLRNLSRPVTLLLDELMEELRALERSSEAYQKQLHDVLVSYTEGPLELLEQYSKTLLGSPGFSTVPSRVELQEKLGSYSQELGLQDFQRGLATYARDLHQKLSPYAADLQGWLNSRWDAVMQYFS